VSVINGEVTSSTLVESSSLPWLKTPQELEEQTWKIEEKLYKEKYLKKRATEINYKMHEIKPSYCSEITLLRWGMAMAL
jgi:hypothetical protein